MRMCRCNRERRRVATMHRKYSRGITGEILKIRAAMPTAAIGADVMVGFPGETDAEFDERAPDRRTAVYLPARFHLFGTSGTPAAEQPAQFL